MSVVPILQYHSVAENPPEWAAPLTVRPDRFDEQLEHLAHAQMSVVPLRRLVSAIRGGPPLPPRAMVLTFDEGFADFYWTVAPMLAARELPATLFVVTGAIHPPGGRPSGSRLPPAMMLNWRQVAGLDAYGIEIGGHSRTHPALDTVSGRTLRSEIEGCKRDLEDALGHEVTSYAYPLGYHGPTVRRAVRQAGWDSACATSDALATTSDDPLRLCRLTVRHDTPISLYDAWIHGRSARLGPPPESLSTWAWRLLRRTHGPGH
ncbi:polysaccharide deacetylase family protein [Streptacidiphilus jiangxiensis]|uniref:Polysaccharide deacetylase n=1 Tax=Streptacidiphilus jiangxiensis TaxID=235985 RepID=A0A1H7QNL7_STRJI|nr:polysaccharide deacetylase family protein [Streptacidiphilus jiangxiensis]SEL49532.1 Polysaccharide deacetylase [Streptacidiphilus jiangxiensis]